MWFTQLTGIITTENDILNKDEGYNWMDTCVDTAPCLALIDTGTSYITMPSSVYNKLIEYLVEYTSDKTKSKANCIKYGTDFMCNTKSYTPDEDLPFIWFQVGGHAFKLRPSQYMLTGTDSCAIGYDCMGISFLDSMGQHTYIMGDTFLREYYLVFDETHYKVGIGSLDDELTVAIPRPPINDFWSYIEMASYIIGAIGVIVCIIASLWKLKKPPSFATWKEYIMPNNDQNDYNQIIDDDDVGNENQNENENDGYNLLSNDNDNDDNNNSNHQNVSIQNNSNNNSITDDNHNKDYRTTLREKREAFLSSSIISIMEGRNMNNDNMAIQTDEDQPHLNFSDDDENRYQVL